MAKILISKCANCGNTGEENFLRLDGFYALTKVEKKGEEINFMPSSGMPMIVFLCKKCGELKLFPAKVFGEF